MTVARAWAVNLGSCVFQAFLVAFLGIFVFYLGGYLTGEIVWGVTGDGHLGIVVGPIASAIVAGILYCIAWPIFWTVVHPNPPGKWRYGHVLFAWIPLVFLLVTYRPSTPGPMSMQLVNMPNAFVFSTIVTAVILFPLYSLWIYRYLLTPTQTARSRAAVTQLLSLVIVGALVYPSAWHTMHFVYGSVS